MSQYSDDFEVEAGERDTIQRVSTALVGIPSTQPRSLAHTSTANCEDSACHHWPGSYQTIHAEETGCAGEREGEREVVTVLATIGDLVMARGKILEKSASE